MDNNTKNLINTLITKDKKELLYSINNLINILLEEKNKLEKLENYYPSECGIVQRRGVNIDDLCKAIGEKNKIINYSNL